MKISLEEHLDLAAVERLIQRERAARDAGRWEEMASCYHPESHVAVSWFKGSGMEFVERSKTLNGKNYGFHEMSPAVVTLRGDRALADSGCSIHAFVEFEGVDIDINSHCRLLWRVQRSEQGWLIMGLRAVYLRDSIFPIFPGKALVIDEALYRSLRPSYRSIAYVMKRSGRTCVDDLPGVDRPESVARLEEEAQAWLREG